MASLEGEQSASELLRAQTHAWNFIFHFAKSMSVKCAIQLGIPDIIRKHGQPMTLPQLLAALKLHPPKAHCIHRLMRFLVHSGFFAHQIVNKEDSPDEEEYYFLTPASQLLLKEDGPFSVAPFLSLTLDPVIMTPWHFLSTWFENDNNDPTPFETAHGMAIWDRVANETRFKSCFYSAMVADSDLIVDVVIKECKGVFEGLKSLVDVGGGTGTMAKAIAKAFPALNCTVFDLPHVVANQQGTENLDFLGGDMFETIPLADGLLLKWILHDWDDERSIQILKRCREAIPSKDEGGKVIIIDIAIDDEADKETVEAQLSFDLLMMVVLNGKERTVKEWKELFQAAGFSDYKISPILGVRSLIELYP